MLQQHVILPQHSHQATFLVAVWVRLCNTIHVDLSFHLVAVVVVVVVAAESSKECHTLEVVQGKVEVGCLTSWFLLSLVVVCFNVVSFLSSCFLFL